MTGFGPFPGIPHNASASLVKTLAHHPGVPEIEIAAEIIPVVWADARGAALDAAGRVKPHAVLHFGVSKHVAQIEIETRAFNMSGPKEDYAGAMGPGKRLVPSGAPILRSTLPPLPLLKALRQGGFRSELSNDAGRYLCNALFYWSLAEAAAGGPMTGFIHIPAIGVEGAVRSHLSEQEIVAAAHVLIRASAEAVLRAKRSRNGKRRESERDGPQAFHGNGRGSRRVVWHGPR
ncbi:MAG: pyroglutamyl-peptidase I [Rhodomicrobium sp.]|nr:pyroglutamyl-peptidase I [Rhodomicrobium sp.]